MMQTKAELRVRLREQRKALSREFCLASAQAVVEQLCQWPVFTQSRRIAVYLPNDNELDVSSLCMTEKSGQSFYLPALLDKQLIFRRFVPGDVLVPNIFGILEPVCSEVCDPAALDLVCVPLVGFDAMGHRLGMGGGYYDRTFAFKKQSPVKSPYLLGIAYECQEVPLLPTAAWDITLEGIWTEEGYRPAASQ